MASASQDEHESYRLIVLDRDGAEVLLVPSGGRFMLPSVEIPRWQRVAENLTVVFKTDWGSEVVCLFELPAESADGPGIIHYQAAEHLSTCGSPKMPTRWIPVSALYRDSLKEECDCEAIKQVLRVCCGEVEGACAGPFARLGWFREVCDWIESAARPMGIRVKGEFRQLNASPSFSLVRFETDSPALWFKAVGEPNQREYPITCALARFLPDYLPAILATRPRWNGWLSSEVRGKLLSEVQDCSLWERAAVSLAKLQVQSIDHGSEILGAGARDLGSAALSKIIRPFMDVVTQLMERQTKIPPPVLGRKERLRLADVLESSIHGMDATGMPETLGHLDLNPGNIIISDERCTFLDWAEAYVGNPLFSLEYLLQHTCRAFGENSDVRTNMIAAYCAQWDGVISPGAIRDALAYAPLLAVFAYAVGNDLWKQPSELQDQVTAGYQRALARRMHREAKELAERRTVCLR